MGVKDSTMKKTRLGYQFDHNVYIGYQINDNRVVTIKELENVANIAAAASGGVAHITLSTSALTEAPSNVELDQIDFNNNGTITHEKIVPGYLAPETTIPTGAKLCVIAPAGDGKAYRVYVSNTSASDIVTISGDQIITGKKTFTQDGHDPAIVLSYDERESSFMEVDETQSGYSATFSTAGLTDEQHYTFPDKSGTVALLSDLPTDTDTWRAVKVNGTQLLGTAVTTGAINLKNGSNVSVTGSGNDVTIAANNYYPTAVGWTNGTTSGPVGNITMSGTSAVNTDPIPTATNSQSGVVTTAAQTFSGQKTFDRGVIINPNTEGDKTPLVLNYNQDNAAFLKANDSWSNHSIEFNVVYDVEQGRPILSGDRQYYFPNKDGTVILDSDLGTAAYRYVSDTVVSGSPNLVTGDAVYDAIAALPEPMIFKGTVGDAGDSPTITWANLPTASGHEGYTYKVITDHTSAPVCEVGDTIISNGSAWVVIPSGDEPSGTVTSVGITPQSNSHLTSTGGPITSAGSITIGLESGYSIPSNTAQSLWDAKLQYMGSIGINTGDIHALPTVHSGDVYNVVEAGTYNHMDAEVGDLFIGGYAAWIHVPGTPELGSAAAKDYTTSITSGGTDLPTSGAVYSAIAGIIDTNTWRNIKVNGTELLGTGISTGAVNFKNGGHITVTGSGNDITLGVATNYSIPSTSKQSGWDAKLDDSDIKKLDTTVTDELTPSASESLTGSGTIQLHKVSKTGVYSDLRGKPILGTAAARDAANEITDGDPNLPTGDAVYGAIDNLNVVGTLGMGGTYTQLPSTPADYANKVLIVITDGTYDGIAAKAGDFFLSRLSGPSFPLTYHWNLISGSNPGGTVTSVTVATDSSSHLTSSGGTITTAGTITIGVDSPYSIPLTSKQSDWDGKMEYKGAVGSGASYTDLPTDSSEKGDVYSVLTDGTYNTSTSTTQAAHKGDLFIRNGVTSGSGSRWWYVPGGPATYIKSASASGNTLTLTPQSGAAITYTPTFTDTDTYRPIRINGVQVLSDATSTGYVNFKSGNNISINGSNSHDITIAATNVVTTNTQQTITGQKTFTNWAAFQCDYDSPVQIQYSNNDSGFLLVGDTSSSYQMSFDHAGLTDSRGYSFPDKSGTVALLDDIADAAVEIVDLTAL